MKDKEHWKNALEGLTPYEASELFEVIGEMFFYEYYELINEVTVDELASKFRGQSLLSLLESLATRHDIVDYLKELDRSEWCTEGKILLKSIMGKRKKLFEQLQIQTNENTAKS